MADNVGIEAVNNTELHLLHIACACACDHLLVTSIEPASEFLEDLTATRGLGSVAIASKCEPRLSRITFGW